MITTYVGIGSNLQRHKHIRAATRELKQLGAGLRLSTIYECPAMGFNSHPFFNLVAEFQTEATLIELSKTLRSIELKWGRSELAQKFQDRTLDLDIILFGDQESDQPQIPRQDIYKYPFVIQPLYELSPELIIPGDGRNIRQLWQQAQDLECLIPVPIWFDV